MFKVVCFALAFGLVAVAVPRTTTEKIVKSDTTVVTAFDSTVVVREDTIKIVKTYKDTALVVKTDTFKTHSAPRIVAKPVKK